MSLPPKDVVELMQSSLFDLFEDEYGNLDFRRTTGVSKSGQVKAFVQALSKVAARESNSVFTKVVRLLLSPVQQRKVSATMRLMRWYAWSWPDWCRS